MNDFDFDEPYDDYEARLLNRDRRYHRQRRPRKRPKKPPAAPPAAAEPLPDDLAHGSEALFDPTFMRDKKEDNHERQWIIEHLADFYLEDYITDVLYNVKGGKEASVYCCTAHPSLGVPYVAAKVYRPAMFRSLKNDALYREGRVASRDGHDRAATLVDGRTWRALKKGTRFGQQLRLAGWIEVEFAVMTRLYEAGVDVPRPIGHKGHAILMDYLGDGIQAAPTLHHVRLQPEEAQPLFDRLWRNIELMFSLECVHGDFSAFNVLYWEGEAKIIDFPQAVNPFFNQNALALLQRDVTRLCQYFARYKVVMPDGQPPDPAAMARGLWHEYMPAE